MKQVYGMFVWVVVHDDQKPGRSEGSIPAEFVRKVSEIICIDANFTTRILAKGLNTSINTTISTKDLGKRKVCARLFHMN